MKLHKVLFTAAVLGASSAWAQAQPQPKIEAPAASEARDKNIVEVAVGSPDHTTLVAALKAADYVASLTNPGPFTVFAPTNAAFAALPKETLDTLLKPENKAALQDVLKFHVCTTAYEVKWLKPGKKLGMANGSSVDIGQEGNRVTINGAHILATIRAGNGNIHVIDKVLVPPKK